MKRIISCLCTVAVCLSLFSASALAYSEEVTVLQGALPTFQLIERGNDEYTLETYYNDLLTSEITWQQGDDVMTKTMYHVSSNETARRDAGITYSTFRVSDYFTKIPVVETYALDNTWYYYMTIKYNISGGIDDRIKCDYRSTGVSEEPYRYEIYAGTDLSEFVAAITVPLIDIGINKLLISLDINIIDYSTQLAIFALARAGAKAIDGIINATVQGEMECVRYNYRLRIYSTAKQAYVNEPTGQRCYVWFGDDIADVSVYHEGYTPQNTREGGDVTNPKDENGIRDYMFAKYVWSVAHPGYKYEGVAYWD